MTEAREGVQEVFYGVKFSSITNDMLEGIAGIYYSIAEITPASWRTPTVKGIADQLRYSNAAEYRIGSRYSMHSKLWVRTEEYLRDESGKLIDRVVSFSFDPNMDFRNGVQRAKLQVRVDQFKKAASDYVLQTGLGVALEPR